MNSLPDQSTATTTAAARVPTLEEQVREHPLTALCCAIAVGVAAGFLVRALSARPETTGEHFSRVFGDARDRVVELSRPAVDVAGRAANDAFCAARGSVNQLRRANLGERVRSWFR